MSITVLRLLFSGGGSDSTDMHSNIASIIVRLFLTVVVFGTLGHLSWELGDRMAERLGLRHNHFDTPSIIETYGRALGVQRIARARTLLDTQPLAGEAALVQLVGESTDPTMRTRAVELLVAHAVGDWPKDSRGSFLQDIAPAAIQAGRAHGIPPSITLAQAALESGWGRSRLARIHHNLFGVKATGQQRAVVMPTVEHTDRGAKVVRGGFRIFDSDAASLRHHAYLLSEDARYADAKLAENWQAYLRIIAPVYATDKAYAHRIGTIIRRHRLDRWDAITQWQIEHEANT